MAAVAALLSLCFGAHPRCFSWEPLCGVVARVPGKVARVAVSHDDKLVAVSASSGLHVYNVATGAAVAVPTYASALGAAFSPDAGELAVALGDGGVAAVSLSNGTELWSDSLEYCTSVVYSPDGTRLVTGHGYGKIYIRNAATGASVLPLTGGHSFFAGAVYGLTYTLDGERLISGSNGDIVVVWNAATGAMLKTLRDHTSDVRATQVSPDGLYFASVGYRPTDTLNIYKLSDYTLHKKIEKEIYGVSLSFSQGGRKIAVAGAQGHIAHWSTTRTMVYTVDSGTLSHTYYNAAETQSVAYFHNSDSIITAEHVDNAGILLWEAAPPTPSPPTPSPPTPAPPTPTPPQVTAAPDTAAPTPSPPTPVPSTQSPPTPAPPTLSAPTAAPPTPSPPTPLPPTPTPPQATAAPDTAAPTM